MSVVENNLQKQPVAIPQSLPTSTHTDEQIAELNELLVHVLDELSAMKEALHANAKKKAEKKIHKLKAPNKRQQEEEDETATENVEARDDSEEEEAESDTVPPPRRPQAHPHPVRTKGLDFSSCF